MSTIHVLVAFLDMAHGTFPCSEDMGGIVSRDAGAIAARTLADGLERAAGKFGERAAGQLRVAALYLSVAAVFVALIIANAALLGIYIWNYWNK